MCVRLIVSKPFAKEMELINTVEVGIGVADWAADFLALYIHRSPVDLYLAPDGPKR